MRNQLCPCGSGKKYKHCCGAAGAQPKSSGASPDKRAAHSQFLQGVQALRSGQSSAAVSLLLAAIRSDETHFDAHHALAAALMQSGQFADASQFLRRAVELRPDSAAAYADLGTTYDRQNMHEPAILAYRKAVELKPNLGHVQYRLGELYVLYSRSSEAADCFERAADAGRNHNDAKLYRSDAQLLRGDIPGAEQWARKAVALEPASSAANGTLGGVLYLQGRFDEAATYFEGALRVDPTLAKCWDGLAHCRKFSTEDKEILDRMGAVLRRSDLPDANRMTIHFAMGKINDDMADYVHAMEQFDAGNKLRAKDLRFDRAGLAAEVDRNIQLFTPAFIARHAASGSPNVTPLFIVGMNRSGTTLVEQIVSSHPQIAAGGELTVWGPADLDIDPTTGDFNAERSQEAIAKYLSVLHQIAPDAARVTDKLPFNFLRLGAIHSLLPNARIIHCQRDPIDTCLSIYTTLFSSRVPYAARKADLVYCYQQYLRIIEHWRNTLPAANFIEVHYETLIANRESETKRLISFTGLPWDETCLRPEQNKRTVGTSSAWQVRQPVYATSMQRWRRYEPWLGELRALLADA